MTLYLYRKGTQSPLLTMENVVSYTADTVTAVDGRVFGPFAGDCELSSKEDCSETLRADWREENPSETERVEALELLVAQFIFGGEAE